ncbi:mitochondrial proton/calcium exchanger protein [Halyomorpha halys]|uniref:mitochondrial proton/calcium exchanger protein n=1 Tax=Halyomorpha halys TaxID=286706 RepID=UPI0034D208DB
MYCFIKHNRILAINTKAIAKGTRFKKSVLTKLCPICSPLQQNLARSLASSCNSYKFPNYDYEQKLCGYLPQKISIPVISYTPYFRSFHSNVVLFSSEPLKPSSKVEETVHVLKEKAKEQLKSEAVIAPVEKPTAVATPKKSLKQKVVDELVHYYHGFRLLFIDMNVSRKLIWRILNGKQLTRREHKLLVRTVGDMFRLIPFSVFIIVPFMELALPIFIKLFPGMLPSTFQTSSDQEDKIKKNLKVKLEMTKFLQQTLDEMAVSSKGHSSVAAKEFAEFFQKVRTSGGMTTSEDIMKFSKLFQDEITLDNLPRPQLMALCRVMEMNPIGTTNLLRFQLRLKLRSLMADDKMIQKEGINSLNVSELQAACRARGMRALGISEERLRAQLAQWLELSLEKKVPPSLLLLTQAFMFPDTIPTEQKLAATIQALPDVVATATKAVIGEREGKVDYKTKVEVVKEEIEKIIQERKEMQDEEIKTQQKATEKLKEEIMVDPAPTLMGQVDPALKAIVDDIKKTAIKEQATDDEITSKDIAALGTAIEQKLLFEKESLAELRQEMVEYEEDINDLKSTLKMSKEFEEVKETKAAKRLFKKVNKLISKMDNVLTKLEQNEKPAEKKEGEDVLRIDELIDSIKRIQGVTESAGLDRLSEILNKLDADRDGLVRVDWLIKMLDIIGDEGVKLNKKQISELIELLDKEEAIEMDLQILKQLKKDDDMSNWKKEFEKKRAEYIREKLLSMKTLPITKLSDVVSSSTQDEKETISKPQQTSENKINDVAPIAMASNVQQPQTEINSTNKPVTMEEPKSSTGSPQDLR